MIPMHLYMQEIARVRQVEMAQERRKYKDCPLFLFPCGNLLQRMRLSLGTRLVAAGHFFLSRS